MRCRACGALAGSAARFCDQCGSRLEESGQAAAPTDPMADADDAIADLAPGPGAPDSHATRSTPPRRRGFASSEAMVAPPEHLATSRGRPEVAGEAGDRRVVTALFADLVDYVRLVAEYDAEEVRRRVNEALVAMVDAIEGFDGTREKFIGDAVFAVFGWPIAHDDDALRATHCALAIRAGLGRIQDPAGDALQVRIGLSTGEVVAAPRSVPGALDWSLTGPAVTTAARIQGLAKPGEILLDEATRRAARKELEVEDLGEQVLRGQTRPVRIVRLLGEAGFQPWRPLRGKFVGRAAEREVLRRVIGGIQDGRGATVFVEGDAGIGKSRLLADLEADVRRAGLRWSWVDNVSYGSTEPYRFTRAVAQVAADEHGTDSGSFARELLFTPDVDPDMARRWAGGIAAVAREAAFTGWEAEAQLVPADPAEVAEDLRSVAKRYMDRLIEIDGPRVMVIDDLHWLDQSSAGIFEELVGLTDALPLALLVGGRPGSWPATLDRSRLIRISLEGLDVAETGELARSVAGVAVQPDDILRLHARTGGNPLFIGETVRAIVDDGAITADGRLALGGPGHQPVPATLRALLGSRIDALTPESRAVLRVASVLGMSFHEDVVDDVLAEHVDAARYERLAEAAMIVPIDASGGWRFCHPLIHDAAYAGLLATDRKALHTRVADRMEAGARTGAIGAIARHRAEAGDAVRAVPALIRAAESAVALGARAEAAAYLEMAIGLEGDGPARSALERRLGEIRSLADALAPGATGLDAPVPARAAGVGHGAGVLAEPGQGGRGGGLPG